MVRIGSVDAAGADPKTDVLEARRMPCHMEADSVMQCHASSISQIV